MSKSGFIIFQMVLLHPFQGARGSESPEAERPRTAQSFLVPVSEIEANDFDLSINRYKEIMYEAVDYDTSDKSSMARKEQRD